MPLASDPEASTKQAIAKSANLLRVMWPPVQYDYSNTAVDSSLLLFPSSFFSPSRVRTIHSISQLLHLSF